MKKWIVFFLIIDLLLVSTFCFLYINNLLPNLPEIINKIFNKKFVYNLNENFNIFFTKLRSLIANLYNNLFKNREELDSEAKDLKKEVTKEENKNNKEEEQKQIEDKTMGQKKIELEEIWQYHYGNYLCIFGLLKNMSNNYAATNVSLSYSLYDPEGYPILKTSKIVKFSYLLPEQSAPFSLITELSHDTDFKSYEIDSIRDTWVPFNFNKIPEFEVSNISLTYHNSRNMAKGFVRNISDKDFNNAKILISFYDDENSIIAVGSDYLLNLKVGENIPFIVDTKNLPCIQKKARSIELFLFPQFDEI